MSFGHLFYFMFTVAIECSPLDCRNSSTLRARCTPIEFNGLVSMADNKLASFVMAGQCDHE